MNVLGTISIPFDPYIIGIGPFLFSWHGFFTVVGVAVAVFLVHKWGTKQGMNADGIMSVVVWCIVGGIVGARILHVVDFWNSGGVCGQAFSGYGNCPLTILMVWKGGIAILGAVLGGFTGGATYIMVRNSDWFLNMWGKYFAFFGKAEKAPLPEIGIFADLVAPALLLGMAIGRIGDIINGEHFAKFTTLPWGVIYSHGDSPGLGRPASHPAVGYELIFDLLIIGVLWMMKDRLRPHGMIFALAVSLYAIGRFFISFLRVEANTYFGLNEAQIVCLAILLVTIPLLVYKANWGRSTEI